ncbi:diguanylate cyclase [Shigella dysenteriae]|nr:diguanylate cyclase [Shigella dysenteriae]
MDNAILENILRQVRPLIGQGKVADYIPALATVDGSRLGIAICTVDGQLFQAGDAQERFSIQSISKVLSLVVAMRHYSEEEIWQRVGKDPSGSPFNSLVQLEMEQGIPRNPFINAGAIGSVSIDSLDFWPLLADWFSEQFSTGVLIVPCMLTLAIPGVLPRFKAEQMMPAIALIVSVIASVVIGGAGSLAFPLPALIWCAVRYTPQVTCLLTFVTGAVEIVLVANSVIDISVGSPFSIPEMFSARLGIATMAICPIMVSFSVAAINSLMKQVALRADFDFLTQVYSRSGLYEALKSPSLKQTQHLTVMLLDIDYFKSINDNYGHECGDKVLSVFARHIQKIVGDKGLVARMGGEEFAVAVPSVNPVDGLLMAEKIRKGVELQPFTWQQKTLYLTVSIGVGSGRASYRTLTDDFNKLMVEADTCLYRSKKDGRNRTSTMRYGEEVV